MAIGPGCSVIEPFPCSGCGLCCRNVDKAEETRGFDRGDGTCRHFIDLTRTCGIYDDRPDICRVDRQFAQRYASSMSWYDFVALNVRACEMLQALPDSQD